MHIIITGSSGFIGSHFVPMAVAAGHRLTLVEHITSTDHHSKTTDWHNQPINQLHGGLDALANDVDLLASADVVCHFACRGIPATSNANPLADIDGNLATTVALLEAMRIANCHRILFLSSGGAVYGRPLALPIKESHPTAPISSYGVVKLAIESYLNMYADQYEFRPTILRPSNTYGPGQFQNANFGAVTNFLQNCHSGKATQLYGDGGVIRDYIYVSDICELILRALQQDKPGTYNCGTGVGTDLKSLIREVETVVSKPLEIKSAQARDFDPDAIVLDTTRAQSTFGWRPQISLRQGLRLTYASMERRGPEAETEGQWQANAS